MPRFALCLGLGLLGLIPAGCRTVPATVDTGDDAPSPAPKVFVEDQARPTPVAPEQTPLAGEYVELYACWFERPYSYMFEDRGPPLEVDGRSYGMLMAGIHGILYYGHLNDCAGRLTGTAPRSYSDLSPLAELAGVPATIDDASLPFAAVNPAFVAWARSELLPPSDQLIVGIPARMAYERVFSRFFRTMATSAVWLAQAHGIDGEAQTYLRDVEAGAHGIDWLEQRYGGSIPIQDASADGTSMTGSMAAGFWLRRELDGSLSICWHTLVDVLARYDEAWLHELETAYAAGFQALSAQPDVLAPAESAKAP